MKIRKVTLIITFNIVLFYVLSEIAMAFLGLPKLYYYHNFPPHYKAVTDREIVFVSLPNTSIDFTYEDNPRGYFHNDNTVNHVTNKYGFRGPEFSLEKATNSARIIFLGDSFTFGEGVYFEDTYPEQFKKLAEKNHLFGRKHIEVINLAVSTYGTKQEWALLKNFASQLHPDLVVIGYVLNDPQPIAFKTEGNDGLLVPVMNGAIAPFIFTGMDIDNVSPLLDFLNSFSRLSKLFTQIYLDHRETTKNIIYYKGLFKDTYSGWKESKEDISQFGKYEKTNHVPIIGILFPLLFQLNKYSFLDLNKKVLDEFSKNSIITIDLLPYLKGYKEESLWVDKTDQHPNEIVHKIAAEVLFNDVKKKSLNLSQEH